MPRSIKFILPVIFWVCFVYVVARVDYPDNITQANFLQLASFFISLFLALVFSINLFLSLFSSLSITLGMIILLVLKSLDSLNAVSVILTLTAVWLMLSYFKTLKRQPSLTSRFKVPKLRSLQRKKF